MYLSADDARSDVILAGAATAFGGILLQLLLSAPGVPTGGIFGEIVTLLGWFALSGLVPLLLARYRDDVPGAFALGGPARVPIGPAALLALPAALLGVARGLLVDGSLVTAALGRVGRALVASPTVGGVPADVAGAVLTAVGVLVLTVGSLLLVAFVSVRGRDAFRSDDRRASQLLRTLGLSAVALAFVAGSARALAGSGGFGALALNVVAAAAIVLLVDRLTGAASVTRPAVLTPAVLVLVAHVLAAGGLFRGDLFLGLTTGGLGAATTIAAAVAISQRRTAAVVVPLLLAVHWWPTCLSPLPFGAAGC
jgi:hypothetical protein